ncbi:MAG: non-heme iron oxygenase ferredoxin subunit [Rhodoferax sp.]|uniref:non-heme iron oxygenase ferredoxin subunit n=1 Tax=Rhodoferax sp. TaxID=50421 RepID=UPI00271F80F8|nr:non-heme iron oxygenase ferredoxin subunit [Rhodoferax sp.]MDO8451201.1 non-heme iron oxygenase ferredoxin subunit [Rhodoferax sp.]
MEQKDPLTAINEMRLCRIDVIEDGEALRLEIDGRPPLAVFHANGEFYVTDDTCSHGDASLSEGSIEDGHVECPWHSGRFCLKTGSALTFPAVTPIKVYKTIVREGELFIQTEPDPS